MSWKPPYRSSKFRHVYGRPASKEQSYSGLPVTRGVHDNHCCAVNPHFVAVVTECTGGGAFVVIPIHQSGRVNPLHPRVCGHSARVLDVKWDPFDDQRIASCSEDCTIKLWEIPNDGLRDNLIKPSKELLGHTQRAGLIEWHPTAKDILLSSAYDYHVCVWRVDGAGVCVRTPVCVFCTHTDLVTSVSFSEDGSTLATTCRDRRVRVLETHTGRTLQERSIDCNKVSKILFLSDLNLLLTTGTSKWNQRQFTLWNPEDLSEPLLEEDVDGGSGVLFPFYDPDTHMLYLAGKGDGNIRYYEVSSQEPYIHFLADYRSPLPQRGLGAMPKQGLDTAACEVFRFYRLLTVKDLLEPLSFIVPRKAVDFQEDIYPLTASNEATVTAREWITGQNKAPVMMSLRPGTQIQNPYPAPEQETSSQSLRNDHAPEEEQPANQKTGCNTSDLSEWQEDETRMDGWSDTQESTTNDNPPSAENELINLFHELQEEIRSLKQQLDQRDSTIQHLETELKNIRNQLRASY